MSINNKKLKLMISFITVKDVPKSVEFKIGAFKVWGRGLRISKL